MQKAFRKIYISIMLTIFCIITAITATYAWLGVLSISKFDEFDIDIQQNELNEYGVELSLDGINFTNSIELVDLQKAILINTGINEDLLTNDQVIQNYFNTLNLAQCTMAPNSDNTFSDFKDISGNTTNKIFKFDLFISPCRNYGDTSETEYIMDCYLIDEIFEGTEGQYTLFNDYIYPSDFNNPNSNITPGTNIRRARVNSESASRLAIQKYKVVDKYHPEQYVDYDKPLDYIIYQGGLENPTYDKENDLYDFGSIIETKYNMPVCYLNEYYGWNLQVPEWAINRGDIIFNENTNQIIDSSKEEEKMGIHQMMKLTIYFWFEGWDPDCFAAINRKPVNLKLRFSTNYKEHN